MLGKIGVEIIMIRAKSVLLRGSDISSTLINSPLSDYKQYVIIRELTTSEKSNSDE